MIEVHYLITPKEIQVTFVGYEIPNKNKKHKLAVI